MAPIIAKSAGRKELTHAPRRQRRQLAPDLARRPVAKLLPATQHLGHELPERCADGLGAPSGDAFGDAANELRVRRAERNRALSCQHPEKQKADLVNIAL